MLTKFLAIKKCLRSGIIKRLNYLEEARKTDRRDIMEALDIVQKSIAEQFEELKIHYDAQFDRIFSAQAANDIEHREFKKLLYSHGKRLDFYNSRISRLEEWKEDMDSREYTAV